MNEADIIAYLEGLGPRELRALLARIELRWDVQLEPTPELTVVFYGAPPMPTEIYNLHLVDFGDQKVQVIATLRKLMPLMLREAKALVESAPCVLFEDIDDIHDALRLRDLLEGAGATVEIETIEGWE